VRFSSTILRQNWRPMKLFFQDTKEACQAKATEWSVRTRLRTEELNGMQEAIKILSSGKAQKTFESATTTFVQIASVHKNAQLTSARNNAYAELKKLATQYKSRSMAMIAVEVKTGGHFDKVIVMIDQMMAVLRAEEQEDIEHRDRCENAQNANSNEMADLKHDIQKTEDALKRMGREAGELKTDISNLESDISDTKKEMSDLLSMRNDEEKNFRKALKDDTDAVALLEQAIAALSKYYTNNKMDVPQLLQKAPEYTNDEDKAPSADFAKAGSRKSETGGILAILEMLKEDLQKEIKEGRADDADAQAKYNKQNGALQATLDGQEQTKANTESELGDLEDKINSFEKHKSEKESDKSAEEDTEASLGTDCAWVETHFDDRRQKRKTEMQGLVDAKAFLAGVAAGDDPLPLAA